MKIHLSKFKKHKTVNTEISNLQIINLFDPHENYTQKALAGEHGKTLKFYDFCFLNRILSQLM